MHVLRQQKMINHTKRQFWHGMIICTSYNGSQDSQLVKKTYISRKSVWQASR